MAPTAMSDDKLTAFLAKHPRLTGVLFTALLLLSTAAPVVAGDSGKVGP